MMATKFVPVDLSCLEEGNFLNDANSTFQKLQQDFLKYCEMYGTKADKSKFSMQMEVTVKCVDQDREIFVIHSDLSYKMPNRPTEVTSAMPEFTDDIPPRHTLFVKRSGGDSHDPRQMKLATQDGRTIG